MDPPRKRRSEEGHEHGDGDKENRKRFLRDQSSGGGEDGEVEEALTGSVEQVITTENCRQDIPSTAKVVAVVGQECASERGSPHSSPAVEVSLKDIMDKALSIDLIREKIVGYVIQNEIERGSSRNDMRSVRLVSKSWLQDVNTFLHKSGQPLYPILLPCSRLKENIPNGFLSEVEQLLNWLTQLITSSTRQGTKMPPFSLKIDRTFYREDNHQNQSFSNFLEVCASGLVELTMTIPLESGSRTFRFPQVNLNFPNLCKLTLELEGKHLSSSELLPAALLFIQSILNGSQKLKTFNMKLVNSDRNPWTVFQIPRGIRNLNLPSTITTLHVASLMRHSVLDVLLNFDLPQLHTLSFSVFEDEQPANGLVSRILEKYRSSLRYLNVDDRTITYLENRTPPTIFRFPPMDKMESLCIKTQFAELEEGHSPLENLLPNLKTLSLGSRTIATLKNWTKSSTFPDVTTLSLTILEGSSQLPNFRLSDHFPNLSTLTLHIKGEAENGDLNQILLETTELKTLKIILNHHRVHGDWDVVLTGISGERLRQLRNRPELWPNFRSRNQDLVSIANLQELENLEVYTINSTTEGSLISDLVFHLAFLQMPKLKTLHLSGGFKVSAEMAQVWRDRGCILVGGN